MAYSLWVFFYSLSVYCYWLFLVSGNSVQSDAYQCHNVLFFSNCRLISDVNQHFGKAAPDHQEK